MYKKAQGTLIENNRLRSKIPISLKVFVLSLFLTLIDTKPRVTIL